MYLSYLLLIQFLTILTSADKGVIFVHVVDILRKKFGFHFRGREVRGVCRQRCMSIYPERDNPHIEQLKLDTRDRLTFIRDLS